MYPTDYTCKKLNHKKKYVVYKIFVASLIISSLYNNLINQNATSFKGQGHKSKSC